jgi:hypothetical protein
LSVLWFTVSDYLLSVLWFTVSDYLLSVLWFTASDYLLSVPWFTVSDYLLSVRWFTVSDYLLSVLWFTVYDYRLGTFKLFFHFFKHFLYIKRFKKLGHCSSDHYARTAEEHHGYNTRSSQFNFVVPKIKGVDSSSFLFNAIKT